jgi:penicillin-binding protein 1A
MQLAALSRPVLLLCDQTTVDEFQAKMTEQSGDTPTPTRRSAAPQGSARTVAESTSGPTQRSRSAATRRRNPPEERRRPWAPFAVIGWFARIVAAPLAIPMDLALLGVAGAAVVLSVMVQDLPEVDALLEVKFEEPLRIYTADGSLMAEFGVQRRRAVDFEDIPPDLVNAFVTAEDNRFFDHIGFDLIGLVRAAYAVAQTGSASQGGSTITMQVARNFFLTPEKTVKRKLSEILLALRVESALTKQEIMELYLNKIFFGHRAYGISAAAELYYGKTLDQLDLAEMAMLAGLPKAPSANNPLMNPERALERRDYILSRMLELGFIDKERYAAAVATPLTAVAYTAPIEFRAGYVAEMARQEIVERFGEESAYSLGLKVTTTIDERLQAESDRSIRRALMAYNQRHGYHGPEARIENAGELSQAALDELLAERPDVPELTAGIVTKADASAAEVYLGAGVSETLKLSQVNWARRYKTENWRGPKPRRVTDAVAVGDVIRLRRDKNGNAVLAQVPTVGGALVALSPLDGAIRSLSGGYEFEWSKFNRAADAKRQPGSTFKPFVYAAALGKGYTPASLLKDEKQQFGSWKPENSDGKYMGPIRMRVALTKSRNLAMVNLIDRMGVDYARDFIQRFGYSLDDMPNSYGMALGAGTSTPLQLAAGYTILANGGYRVEPYLIKRIEDAQGNILFEANAPRACRGCWVKQKEGEAEVMADGESSVPQAEQVLDPRIAYNMVSMMQDVIERGTATRAKALKRSDIAGKTGTTNDSRDSWFAGFSPDLVAVAWMGMDDNRPLGRGEWGGTAALGMWMDFMADALDGLPIAEIQRPEGMVAVRVSESTGQAVKRGGIVEYIRDEYQLMTLGPDPVQYAGPPSKSRTPSRPKRTAPRVMDELF